MPTYSYSGVFIAGGQARNMVTVQAWPASSSFSPNSPPHYQDSPPSGSAAATTTTVDSAGSPGAYTIQLPNLDQYWLVFEYNSTYYWQGPVTGVMADEPILTGGVAGPNALAIGIGTNFLVPDLYGDISRSGATDSSSAINNALIAGDTLLGPGTYSVSNPVKIPEGTTLFLTAGAILQAASGYYGNVIQSASYGTIGQCDSVVKVTGFGTIIGGGSANAPTTAFLSLVSGTTLTLSQVPSSWGTGAGAVWVSDVLITYTSAVTGSGGTLSGCSRLVP